MQLRTEWLGTARRVNPCLAGTKPECHTHFNLTPVETHETPLSALSSLLKSVNQPPYPSSKILVSENPSFTYYTLSLYIK